MKIRDAANNFFSAVGKPFSAVGRLLCPEKESPLLPEKAGKDFLYFFARIICFAAFWAIIYSLMISRQPPNFTGDAAGYWNNADTFVSSDGVFAFDNVATGARGYMPGFLIFVFANIGIRIFDIESTVHAYYFVAAAFYSFGITVIAPYVFCKCFGKKFNFLGLAFFCFCTVFWWGGDFAHPLTDLMAMLLVFISAACYLRLREGRFSVFAAFLCGASAAAAYSCRQVYLIFLAAVIIAGTVSIFVSKEKHGFFGLSFGFIGKITDWFSHLPVALRFSVSALRKIIKTAVLLFSVILVMIPQVMINRKYYETDDWQPQGHLYSLAVDGADYSLMLFNANNLMIYYKADFIVNDFKTHDITASVFLNTPYENQPRVTTYADYWNEIKTHPGWFLKSWFVSAFLGMSACYDATYITDPADGVFLRLILNYLLLAVFLITVIVSVCRFFGKKGRAKRLRNALPALVISLSAFLSAATGVLTKVEVRYLIAVYFIAYGVIGFYLMSDIKFNKEALKKALKRLQYFAAPVVIIAFICFVAFLYITKETNGYLTEVLMRYLGI